MMVGFIHTKAMQLNNSFVWYGYEWRGREAYVEHEKEEPHILKLKFLVQ
jgi:hypothetical protein